MNAAKQRIDDLTELLCGILREMRGSERDYMIDVIPKLREWWVEHELYDSTRRAVWDRLTPEEREALWLTDPY